MPTIVFAGGGSGGHLFPGIAVAEELVRCNPQCRCLFVGSNRGIEAELINPYGFLHRGLCAPSSSSFYRSPLQAAKSIWWAYRSSAALLEEANPSVVIGLGSSSSVPTVLAAARKRIPIILLEQNAVVGRANRMLLPFAHHFCSAFDQTKVPWRYSSITMRTGNPIRRETVIARPHPLTSDRRCLLILGGSQGAKAVNEVVVRALAPLRPLLGNWQIIHQTGNEDLDRVRSSYADLGISATVSPFLKEMGSVYAQTALVISRAGGTTLAELAVHSIPTVLIPYPRSVRDHQTLNAKQYEQAGGAVAIPQDSDLAVTAKRLCEVLPPLLSDPEHRSKRGKGMFSLARPDAARTVADLVARCCSEGDASSAVGPASCDLARAS